MSLKETTQIRKANGNDAEDFSNMSREFYASDAVLHNVSSTHHTDAWNEIMRSDEYLYCCIFEQNRKAIGYALLTKSYSREAGGITVWLDEFYIRPDYRGQGLGSRFLKWLEKNIPAARYRLEVEPQNIGATALYRRMGYQNIPYIQMAKDSSVQK